MSILSNLATDQTLFHTALPPRPSGKYVHFVLLRETESFPLFQTDGSLNVIRVRAGLETNPNPISRLIMFKRKQTSPERLSGRELLRSMNIITDDGDLKCVYNSADFCKRCPDCVTYGYAIGSEGAEKSKVFVDTAYSITPYETSHKAFSFNALFEHGTMTEQGTGKTRSSFGEQDHVVPQVFFPSIVTLRDPSYGSFMYVLGNILRTDRYGAQETRTGRLYNHLVGVVFSNGEIFSNLRFTQGIYDQLRVDEQPKDVLERGATLAAATAAYEQLITKEAVTHETVYVGPQAQALRDEVTAVYSSGQDSAALLRDFDAMTRAYALKYGPGKEKAKKEK